MISDNASGIYDTMLTAAGEAFKKLSERKEHFYYCSLMMLEEASPCIAACSEEALAETVKKYGGKYTADALKWSYADSPYCGFGFQEYFKPLDALYREQMNGIPEEAYDAAVEMWLSLMEQVMKTLDEAGLFGTAESRKRIFINAECMPPEQSNIERGRRLNPPEVFQKWYAENWDNADGEDVDAICEYYYALNHPKMCKVILTQPVTDKKTALKIRRDFNISTGFGEFLILCRHAPCTLNDSFLYAAGKALLAKEPLYAEIISLKET